MGDARRRLPRWEEFRELLRPDPAGFDRLLHPVRHAHTIEDLRRLGRRRAPRAVFDYVDGGAGDEVAMRRARRSLAGLELHPRVLRDVTDVSLATTILGRPASMPLVLAPTGFTRMMHQAGERAVAAAAARAGVPYALSTVGTTSPEDLIAVRPDGDRWFQLYVWQDRERSKALVDRVAAAGYSTLVLTVDVPVGGDRRRDVRNGLTIPPTLHLRTFLDGALHPRWWFDFLTTEPIRFAVQGGAGETVQDTISRTFDPSMTLEDVAWLRGVWTGSLVVKGVMRPDDAKEIASLGVDAIVVSNHGGRQLDRHAAPLDALRPVLDAVGDAIEVYVDGGVRTGTDVVAPVALGARAVLVGRAYLYGLMAGGEAGVDRALTILRTDAERTMRLLGACSIDELDPSLVTRRG